MPRKISNKEMVKIEKASKKKKNLPTVTGKWLYTCGTAPLDLRIGHTTFKFYRSAKALKDHIDCWKQCGIIKVKFTYYEVVKGKF